MNTVFVLLGSNIDKEKNLPAAVHLLAQLSEVQAVSSVYETVPVGLSPQPNFFNAAVQISTPLTAAAVKQELLVYIEQQLKRVRCSDKNAPRTIDADIVLFNDEIFDYLGRHIPDPDLLRFSHVAVPIAELIPTHPHPETGERFAAIAQRLLQVSTAAAGSAIVWKRPDVSLSVTDVTQAVAAPQKTGPSKRVT